MHRIISPPPALAEFLDARARGAPAEELKRLVAAAMREQDELKAERSRTPKRGLRLVVDNRNMQRAC
jgi:hypothetical protein